MQETWVQSLGLEDPLSMATDSCILALENPHEQRGAWWAAVHGVTRVKYNGVTNHTCMQVEPSVAVCGV